MGDELVTIGRFARPPLAELARGFLKAHGIESVLQGVESATLGRSWFLDVNVLAAELQVRTSDAVEACRVLAEWEASCRRAGARVPGAEEQCLACGARLSPADRRCAACGWIWETTPSSDVP